MPDFGIRTALSEFGKAVEGRKFKHPETGNLVLYTSLPMDEQHRIYEQWKQYQSLVEPGPKEGKKVENIKDVREGDVLSIQAPNLTIHALVTSASDGNVVAQRLDLKTGKPMKEAPLSIPQVAVESFDVRTIQPSRVSDPFKNKKTWPELSLDDIFAGDVVAYRVKGNDRMGRVTRVSEDDSRFWIQEVDSRTGKVTDKTEWSFDKKKVKDREALLVDEDLWGNFDPDEEDAPSSGKPKVKELSPEEKAKREKEKKEREEAEKKRKAAVEEMGKTGEPLKNPKDVKVGDVVSYHHKGAVHHGRVIDSRGHEFFTIDIDPKTGELKEHGFEEFRDYNLGQMDVHKVKHAPPDPAKENEKALYEGLSKLKEDPEKYFRDDKKSELVDMSKIQPAKVRLKGVLNGNELLAMAAKGKYGKRKPISLIDNGDGTYTVRDGNSTYKNAEISGWGKIPAVIKTKEEWEAHDKEEWEEHKKQLFPSQGQPRVTKEKAPKKKPESFEGEALSSVEGLKKGDMFGYEHDGRWYVGRVDRVGTGGRLFVDALHPDNGDLTTLKFIEFDDDKMSKSKAMRLKDDRKFPKRKKKAPPKVPATSGPKGKGKDDGKGEPQSGKPFMFASRTAGLRELRAAAGILAYRPRWQDTPGYKTVVDQKSQLGITPADTENTSPDRGQSNLDSAWPVQLPQSREKERALPLPSNHSKNREKRIGPTYYNKPRHIPYRTLDEKGDEYGHPTKYDYNMPTRRVDGPTAFDDEEGHDPVAVERQGPFPKEHQKNQAGPARLRSKQDYRQHPQKKRKMRMKYRLRDKRLPRKKLKNKYYRLYPKRYERRGIGFRLPAERTREWREEQLAERRRKGITPEQQKDRMRDRNAGFGALAEAFDLLGLEIEGANWPSNWNTHVKETKPPEQLDQNYGKGQSRDTGTPRKDPGKQKGEDLQAPNLDGHPQTGLKWEIRPPAPGGLDYPDDKVRNTMNPTDGSGKVLPMSYYTDLANNTQQVSDGRQDRYLHNNNFEVKQATRALVREILDAHFGHGVRSAFGPEEGLRRVATTVREILRRCDKKIKERSRQYTPKLARTDTKNWIWHWDVGNHVVRVQAFKRGNTSNVPKLNLRVSCSCPYWRWWGPAHWATKSDYQKGEAPGTATYPKIRDPARWRPVCKHAYAVLEKSQDFFVRPEKSPLKKLGSRFSVDSPAAIEVVTDEQDIVTRVAQRVAERDVVRRVARRYVDGEDS
jgi:hypothetical protein